MNETIRRVAIVLSYMNQGHPISIKGHHLRMGMNQEGRCNFAFEMADQDGNPRFIGADIPMDRFIDWILTIPEEKITEMAADTALNKILDPQ